MLGARSRSTNFRLGLFSIGIILLAISWVAAWGHVGVFSEYSFFPLWLGYILTLNGLSEVMYRRSLLGELGWYFLILFGASIPLWWFFEGVNGFVHNWEYILPHPVSRLEYVVEASLNFSTVIPAILSTSFLVRRILEGAIPDGKRWIVPRSLLTISVLVGLLSFVGLDLFPRQSFPLVWIAPGLLLEPLAYTVGLPSLLSVLASGRFVLPLSVMSATFFTGIWWEFWNYYSLPKWIYHIPYVGFWKIFEMPFLGYFGYPFFGLIVFSWTSLVLAVLFGKDLISVYENPESTNLS